MKNNGRILVWRIYDIQLANQEVYFLHSGLFIKKYLLSDYYTPGASILTVTAEAGR